MGNELISVIIPVYKTPGSFLQKCIDSLTDQSYPNWEALIIDDGTPDADYEKFADLYRDDSRIRFFRIENGGVSAARNFGIEQAKGDYISFLDSDDYVESNFLYELQKAIQDCDLAICAFAEPVLWGNPDRWCDRRIFFSQPAEYAGLPFINFAHNKLYRREILKDHEIRFPTDIPLGEDALFLADYYQHCQSIRCIGNRLYHYVYHGESAVNTYNPNFWKFESQVIAAQWKLFHTYPLSPRQERSLLVWLFWKMKDSVNYYLDKEPNPEIRKQYLSEILNDPHFRILISESQKLREVLSRKDRTLLRIWKKGTASGPETVRKWKQIKRILHR